MTQVQGFDLLPGLTEAEIAKSRLPLPDREALDEEERRAFDEIYERSKRFFASVPLNEGQEYRMTPYFQGLLQSPKVARLWADFGDFYQPAEKRGSFTDREREVGEIATRALLGQLTGASHLSGMHIADATGLGVAPEDIKAMHERRFEDISSPEDRQLAEYARATVTGALTPELFDALVERMGTKSAIEFTSFVCYRFAGVMSVRAMWGVQGREVAQDRGEAVLQAYIVGDADPHPRDRSNSWVEPKAD